MNPELLSLIGILLATAFFIVAVFKGFHVTIVSIFGAVIVSIFSNMDIMTTLTGTFMSGLSSTYGAYFLLFFFSALFAKSLGDSGAAQAIAFKIAGLAKKFPGKEKLMAILSLILIQTIFTLGGISLFVVTFTVLYIAKSLFEELNVPWRLYTLGSVGTSTFTAGLIPGTPQLTNLIPMDYFGTPATAAPVLSIICTAFCLALCMVWVVRQVKVAERKQEGFEPSGTALLSSWDSSKDAQRIELPLWKCLLPSVILFIVLNALKQPAVIALFCATLSAYLIFDIRIQFPKIKGGALTAVQNTNQALIALASATGFGRVVASAVGFQYIISGLENLPGPPVVQMIVSINVAAGFAASSSTGQRLALDMLGDRFLAFGIAPAALHRLSAISSLGLDTLPHSSALANTFSMCKLDYKTAYINNFVISVVITLITACFAGLLITFGLTF